MHYYTFNIGDYASHTKGLSVIEDAAYRRLIDQYYLSEGPIPGDAKTIARSIGMREYLDEVQYVLETYFIEQEGSWRHERCDRELAGVYEKSSKAKLAAETRWAGGKGKKSGSKPKAEQTDSEGKADADQEGCESNADAMQTESERMQTHSEGNTTHYPLPITQLNNSVTTVTDAPASGEQDQDHDQQESIQPEQPKPPNIWDIGVPILVDQGMKEPSARALLGKLNKEFGDVEVGKALVTASMRNPVPADLRSWLPRALQHQRDGPKHKPSQALHTFDHVDYSYGVTADGSF